jgi:hypothetical protein
MNMGRISQRKISHGRFRHIHNDKIYIDLERYKWEDVTGARQSTDL